MIGLTADKLLLIAVLVGFLFGPERLPSLAERLGSTIRTFRRHLTSKEQRMRDQLGGMDMDDWKKLDPRRYDPRTIIKEALTADATAEPTSGITDQEAMAVLDESFSGTDPDPAQSAAETQAFDDSTHSKIRPVFRRRSDGHLELVPTSAAPDEAKTKVAIHTA